MANSFMFWLLRESEFLAWFFNSFLNNFTPKKLLSRMSPCSFEIKLFLSNVAITLDHGLLLCQGVLLGLFIWEAGRDVAGTGR